MTTTTLMKQVEACRAICEQAAADAARQISTERAALKEKLSAAADSARGAEVLAARLTAEQAAMRAAAEAYARVATALAHAKDQFGQAVAQADAAAEKAASARLAALEAELSKAKADVLQTESRVDVMAEQLTAQRNAVSELGAQCDAINARIRAVKLVRAKAQWDRALNELTGAAFTLREAARAHDGSEPNYMGRLWAAFCDADRSVLASFAESHGGAPIAVLNARTVVMAPSRIAAAEGAGA